MLRRTRVLFAAASPSVSPRTATDYSKTLHLPRTTLPPRASPEARPRYLKQCTDDLYAWQAAARQACSRSETFVLHDGPPYANGSLHLGHALNKIVKDILCRFQLSQGKRVEYVPGWDCHGLPIEVKALQALGQSHEKLGPVQVRRVARELAERTIEEQKAGFKEWAVMGNWDNAYKTMEASFELRQLKVFKDMVDKGLIYRLNKPVHWSPSSGSALAEAELEYDQLVTTAAYIKFKLVELPPRLKHFGTERAIHALIWTTTPWTLPANQAIAVDKNMEYCLVSTSSSQDLVIVASELVDQVMQTSKQPDATAPNIVDSFSGSELAEGSRYINAFQSTAETNPIVVADFVSASGTGLVHMAPGHGKDDYRTCRALNIHPFAPVDDHGRYTSSAYPAKPGVLAGKEVLGSGGDTVLNLIRSGEMEGMSLLSAAPHTHSDAIDWRTKLPVIIRATPQWFADVESIKERTLRALDGVTYFPESGKSRLRSFVRGRSEWCISRQRAWGVPIPALYRDTDGGPEVHLTGESVNHIINVIAQRGIDAWWTDARDDPAWIPPHLGSGWFRGTDTMDVWFDSGTSWTSLTPCADGPLADVYFEGSDQHRGWFQSSLLTYVAHQADTSATPKSDDSNLRAPYKNLITHGFLLDEQGNKMSKSKGNVISPEEIINGTRLPPVKPRKQGPKTSAQPVHDAMGPDALRLWVASSDYRGDVSVGDTFLRAIHTSLHKYRVTFKWLLGVLADVKPDIADRAMNGAGLADRIADRIALHQLALTSRAAHSAYSSFEPFKAVVAINKYVNQDLSAFYFETAKDPLYTGVRVERLRVQETCYAIFTELLRMLVPVLPLLVAEVLDHASPALQQTIASAHDDPFRDVWDAHAAGRLDASLDAPIAWLTAAHDAVKAAQEKARADKQMRSGLECNVELRLPPDVGEPVADFFRQHELELRDIFVVSALRLRFGQDAMHTDDRRRPHGGWNIEQEFDLVESQLPGLSMARTTTAKAIVFAPVQEKCPRCWRYMVPSDTIEELGAQKPLCSRCHDALAENAS